MENKYEKRGLLFVNGYKQEDKQPDFTGKCTINGEEYKIAGWKNYREGKPPFTTLTFTPKDEQFTSASSSTMVEDDPGEMDLDIDPDEIPF